MLKTSHFLLAAVLAMSAVLPTRSNAQTSSVASGGAVFVNGVELAVDGGMSAL
jgi:hypothetical protein